MDIFKISTLGKYFRIEFSQKADEDKNFIQTLIKQSFDMNKKIDYKPPKICKKDISVDINHSLTYSKMVLKAKNQKGIIMHIVRIFDEFGIDISTAKISTIKNIARDLFLIQKSRFFSQNYNKIIDAIIDDNKKR